VVSRKFAASTISAMAVDHDPDWLRYREVLVEAIGYRFLA
jgi:hypothetical protein